MSDIIVKVIARFMIPFIQVYGLYIIIYGHLSPGGGFAGGAIVATSLILYILAFGLTLENKRLSDEWTRVLESGGTLFFCFIGLLGIFLGSNFLANNDAGFHLGNYGDLISGGSIFLLTVAIGIKVSSSMISLFSHFLEEDKDDQSSGDEQGEGNRV